MKASGLITIFSCFVSIAFTQYHVNMKQEQNFGNLLL